MLWTNIQRKKNIRERSSTLVNSLTDGDRYREKRWKTIWYQERTRGGERQNGADRGAESRKRAKKLERLFYIMGKWQIVQNVSADCRSSDLYRFYSWRNFDGLTSFMSIYLSRCVCVLCVRVPISLYFGWKIVAHYTKWPIQKEGYHHFRWFFHPCRLQNLPNPFCGLIFLKTSFHTHS